MKTLFVTGAEGFAGSTLVQLLRTRGYAVVAGVRNRARKLAYEKAHGKAIVCDVTDAINVARAIASVKPDGIIHLAGTSRAYEASVEPLTAYQSIVSAWANLLDAVRRTVPRARILLVSAGDVYGCAAEGGHAVEESTAPQPVSTFGSLKAAAESIAQTYFRDYHLNLTVARPFHYLGAHQPESFFFGSVARRLANWTTSGNGKLELPDLSCQRDILHVSDVAEAYVRLLEDGKPNEAYNVCSGKTHSVRQVVEAMMQKAGVSPSVVEQPSNDEGQIHVMWGDNHKLREQLNWRPSRSMEQAVQDLFASFQTPTTPQPTPLMN